MTRQIALELATDYQKMGYNLNVELALIPTMGDRELNQLIKKLIQLGDS